MEYSFNLYNSYAKNGILTALNKFLTDKSQPPVILCIGSDLVIGDSLGPLCGTLIKEKTKYKNCFIYGTLPEPVTAKEVKYLKTFLSTTHPNSKIIVIDAAVGNCGDIGIIKVKDGGLKPGAGVNKNLCEVGDISIMGIVAEKSVLNYSLLNLTRLCMIYKIADIISYAVSDFIDCCKQDLSLKYIL